MMRANGKAAPGRTAAALLLYLASGCVFQEDEKTAGVDEFPNSIYARVNSFLDEGRKSEAIKSAPSLTDSLPGQPGIDVSAGAVAAAKLAAAKRGAESPVLGGLAKASADPGCAVGTLTVVIPDSTGDPARNTTVTICADAKYFDGIKDNETLIQASIVATYKSGRVETADVSDADGDGILNPVPGTESKENIVFTALENGILEKTALVLGPGPDNDFDTERDNQIHAASWHKTRGADTLGYAVYADADGDGVAVDNGKASVVDLDFYQKGPSADHPDALWSRAQMRLVVRYQVEAKEARRVRFEMEDKAGRHEIGEILNRQGGRDFDMRDTVLAHFLTLGAADSDSLDSMDVRLTMSLGADFDAKSDDSIYAIEVRSSKKLGEETDAHFSFLSDEPIPSGNDAAAGALSMSVGYADGTALSVVGTISGKFLDVTLVDREGKRLHVVWDRDGRGVSLEAL